MLSQQIFKLCFPNLFDNPQIHISNGSNHINLLQSIKKYLSDCNQQSSILNNIKYDISNLTKKLNNAKSSIRTYNIFQNGCMIILQKLADENFTRVYLVHGGYWRVNQTTVNNNSIYKIPQDKYQIVFIGQISNSGNLIEIDYEFGQHYKKLSNVVHNWNVNNFPTSTIYLCRKVIQLILNKQNQQVTSKIQRQIKKIDHGQKARQVKISNNIWATQWAYLYFLIKDEELMKAIMLDYKISILKQFIKAQLNKSNQSNNPQQRYLQQKSSIAIFTNCIQQLRSQLLNINATSNYYFNLEKAVKIIYDLSQKIHKIDIRCIEITYSLAQIGRQYQTTSFSINIYNLAPRIAQSMSTNPQNMKNLSHTYKLSNINPIQDLQKRCEETDQYQWVLAVQDTIFTIAYNQLTKQNNRFKKYGLDMIKMYQNRSDGKINNTLMRLFDKYSIKMQKNINYAMGLQCQAYSHIELMKALLCVFGFEIFKKQKKGTILDVSDYKVPLKINQMYKYFNSLSYKARKAMQALYKYSQNNKQKIPFFDQFAGYTNYKSYAQKIVHKSQRIKQQFNKKQKGLNLNKNALREKIKQFYKTLQQMQDKLKKTQAQPNQCYQQQYYDQQYNYSKQKYVKIVKKRFIECVRCKSIKNQQYQINRFKKKQDNYIVTAIPQNDGYIHQFFYLLEPDLQGLISLVLKAQHLTHMVQNKTSHNLDIFSRGKLSIKSDLLNEKTFKYIQLKQSDIEQLVLYSKDRIQVMWYGKSYPTIQYFPMNNDPSNIYNQQYNNYIDFLKNPTSPPSNIAQHNIYAKLSQKPLTIKTDEYITIGSCRIGKYSQIPMCLQGLLNRNINIDTFNKDYQFKKYIVNRCLASLSAGKPQQLHKQANNNIWEGTKYFYTYFMNNYQNQWSSRDFQGLPIIGPILSLMSRTVTDPRYKIDQYSCLYTGESIDTTAITAKKAIKHIMRKTLAEYYRVQQDIRNSAGKNANLTNLDRQNQYFICFSSICCFTELLLNQRQSLAQYFVRLIVIMRFKQVYLSTQVQSVYSKIVRKYQHIKIKAIQNNIQTALKYFQTNPKKLTKVVKIVDQAISPQTNWSKDRDGQFLFQGVDKWGNVYKIDIKYGKVVKNEQSISRVPDRYKQMQEYKAIFQSRDFQVFPSPNKNSFITKRSFTDLFLGNIQAQDSSLFQFAYSNNKPTINLIFRYNQTNTQQTWRLVSRNQLQKYIPLPKFYSQNFYGWYSEKRSCIVFRQPSFSKIGQVVLVAFLDQKTIQQEKRLIHINVISRQHFKANLDLLCDKRKNIFDKLILRNKKDGNAFKILQRVQKVQYILQLQCCQTKRRKFWLHRYDSMFLQDKEHGLIPQSFKNYRVCQKPYSNEKIPWTQKDKIRCLVIQKYVFAETTQQMHKIKIILPEWKCDQNGRVQIKDPKNINQTASFYIYDIHDHFGDIRGGNRASQLHMVSILAAINKNIRNSALRITPLQYAIKILKSCFNNCPLTDNQVTQLKNIMGIASCQQNESLLLMCYALFKCTIQVNSLKSPVNNYTINKILRNQQNFRNMMAISINKYIKKLNNSILPVRQKLPNYIQDILGINNNNFTCHSRGQQKAWRRQNKLCYKLPQKIIQFYIKKYQTLLEQYCKLNSDIIQNKDLQQNKKEQKQFPLDIPNPQQNPLLQQVIKQLRESYNQHNYSKSHIKSIKIVKIAIFQKFTQIHKKLINYKKQIDKIMNGIILQNTKHIDIHTGHLPILNTFDYVNLLIEDINNNNGNQSKQSFFDLLFPDFQSQQQKTKYKNNLLKLIKFWLLFSVKIDSCQRILIIIKNQLQSKVDQKDQQTDKVALFRQIQSPRQQIQKRIYWVCFQAEMKIQIWKSQFQTFKTLFIMNKSGSISQLNMGQGKTQIIIPMITLQLLYADNLASYSIFKPKGNQKVQSNKSGNKIPRINLMQALLNESKLNYFRFLSITAFNIPIVILPFDRQVDIKTNLQPIVRSLGYFKNKMLILVDQSSIHSLMLKLRQQTIKSKGKCIYNKQKTIFKGMDIFDVFDEVDAQLSPKKSFIYSVNKSDELNQADFRISIAAAMLQSICLIVQKLDQQKLIALDDTIDNVLERIKCGEFPRGLRLISNILTSQEIKLKFRRFLITNFLKNINCQQCKFLQILQKQQLQNVIKYLIEQSKDQDLLSNKITPVAKEVLYVFRGFLAYGVFQHCISLRCKVNYGIPDNQRKQKTKKRLAVPYQAADIPSKKNDYAHPDVAIILSYLSYYNFGLTQQQVVQCIARLLHLTANNQQARNSIYRQWYQSLSEQQQQQLKIANILQIQIHSQAQRKRLYTAFRMNRKFIAYWLRNCIFYKDMAQFLQSITSSSWDHADVSNCIGFSGTKDNCRLLPSYVQLIRSDNKQIIGTDGKMIDMLIQHTLQVRNIIQNQQSPWQRFLNTIFNLKQSYNVASIIDAGAILASKSLKDDIIPWISKNKKFNTHNKFKGISFCIDNTWKVFKISNQQYIDRFTSIPDHQTFVIFDEYRTRGADVKMDKNITAVLSLSPDITKDSLMQAVGRLRKIGRNQKVIILLSQQIKLKIKKDVPYSDSMSTSDKIKAIIIWSSLNSIKQNQKYLLPNVKLSRIHFLNCMTPDKPYIDKSDTTLQSMYSKPIIYKPISQLCQKTITLQISIQQLQEKQIQSITKLRIIFSLYGKKRYVKQQNFDQVCQRQTQKITQYQKQIQKQKFILTGLREKDQIQQLKANQQHKFNFSQKLAITKNFIYCTQYIKNMAITKQNRNQIMSCFFILMDNNHICMITQREVYKLLVQQHLPIYMTDYKQNYTRYIARLSDLTINNQFIQSNKLKQALVHCKFYNGDTKYQSKDQNRIIKNLLRVDKNKEDKIKYFLNKRKQIEKFKNTSLEKIFKELQLMPENFNQIFSSNPLGSLENQDFKFQEQNQEEQQKDKNNKQQEKEQGDKDQQQEQQEQQQDEDEQEYQDQDEDQDQDYDQDQDGEQDIADQQEQQDKDQLQKNDAD